MTNPTPYVPPRVWSWERPLGGGPSSTNRPISGATHDLALPRGRHPFQLYSKGTQNGQKVTILFEELLQAGHAGAEYDAWPIETAKAEQFGSDFVAINPNSKIPALLDLSGPQPLRVFESGSILIHLAEKFGAFLPATGPARTEVLNWLMWQMGAAPAFGGGFVHFFVDAAEKWQYPIDRFAMEVKRQMDVLNRQLASNHFIAGEAYSIADMAIWPWYGRLALNDSYRGAADFLDAASYTHVLRWAQELAARPGVMRGRRVNRLGGRPGDLRERHAASDFEL